MKGFNCCNCELQVHGFFPGKLGGDAGHGHPSEPIRPGRHHTGFANDTVSHLHCHFPSKRSALFFLMSH